MTLKSDILNALGSLQVPAKEGGRLARMIDLYENVLNRPVFSAGEAEQAVRNLLSIVGEVRGLAADTTGIRLDLDRLLKVYGRMWAELESGGSAR